MALPDPKSQDGARHQEQRQAKGVAQGTRVQARINRFLAGLNLQHGERAPEGENGHQGSQPEQILAFAAEHVYVPSNTV
jgi:hypothetical protein